MVDFYDIRVLKGSHTTIVLDNGKIEEISSNFSRGAAIRALERGSWGFVSTDNIDSIEDSLESAKRLAEQTNKKTPKSGIKLAPIDTPDSKYSLKPLKDPKDIALDEKIKLLKDLEKTSKVKGVKSTHCVYTEFSGILHYQNSEGIDCEYEITRTGFIIVAVASSNGIYQVGRESRFGVCGFELFDKYNAYEIAEHAGNTAVDLLKAKTPLCGLNPVLLDQELAGVFIHEAVGHATEADLILEGSSILENKINTKIGSSLITVYDDPTLREYGYYPFDAEGAPSKKNTLIENGVLKTYLHSRETAFKLKGMPGNARAQGYSPPIVRMSNTYLAPDTENNYTFEELLEEIKNGIYLKGSRGGQVNTGEGIFQFNAEMGYIIENGELKDMLRDVSLSGHTLEILKKVTAVGNDLEFDSGNCGKNGQLVPISDGSPHIIVSSALVGGDKG
ncbi:MAG: TldD/PmbA family protein [Methanosarcinales archaeon]